METGRSEEFLDLYRQMEEVLEEKYRHEKRRYTSVVFEFQNDDDSAPIREKLAVCRELRNLLTHSANLDGEPVAEPSAPVVEAMREVLHFVQKPPLALEFATKGDQVMKARMDQKVLRLMEVMDKSGYSHVPVVKEGAFCGVFSPGVMFRYLLESGGRGVSKNMTVADLGKYIDIREHMENYEFVSKDETYMAACRKFEKVRARNRRVSVIFITENGRPDERLLGMLTPWDLLGEDRP